MADNLTDVSAAAAEQLAVGDLSAFQARLGGAMSEAVDLEGVRRMHTRMFCGAGVFECVESVERSAGQEPVVFVVVLRHRTCRIQLELSLGLDGTVIGLRSLGRQPNGIALDAAVRIPRTGGDLHGILTGPPSGRRCPIAVLVHGTGPSDADGTVGLNKPFRDLSEGLAQQGIATLRFSKPQTEATTRTFHDEVADVLSALNYARHDSRIDPDAIFVLGHSLGGYLTPHIATLADGLRGAIICAGPTRRVPEVLFEQLAGTPGGRGLFAAAFAALPAHYKAPIRYAPTEVAARLRIPLLILHGGNDRQVSPEHFVRWREALSPASVTFRFYPALDHCFVETSDALAFHAFHACGHFSPVVVEDIARWIHNVVTPEALERHP
jgi:dienelactone hydrolase